MKDTRFSLILRTCAVVISLYSFPASAQAQWTMQTSGTQVRLRGVSAVSTLVAWASGDKGTYLRTVDGGMTWQVGHVPGAEELDFRDVDAFSADIAYLLSIGDGAKSRIYKTTDGGKSWELQFQNNRPKAFFDCMAFWERNRGIAISDPVDGRFLVITTSDGGKSWKEIEPAGMPPALAGEGAFAASGTCVAVQGKQNAWFGTGGTNGARVFRSTDGGRNWSVSMSPIKSGQAAGVFSLTFRDANHGVAVGGDYTKEREVGDNAAWTSDGGKTWRLATADKRPNGYRSGVAFLRDGKAIRMVAVGPNGSDFSTDDGQSWQSLSAEGFHSLSFSTSSKAGWAVGEAGRIARYR